MEWPLLAVLDDAERRDLLASARRRRFRKDEVVFHEGDTGDSLHLVHKGRVAVRITTPLGDTAMVEVLAAGDFFGELALIRPATRSATVMALDAVETLAVSQTVFAELRERHPAVERVLTEALVGQVRRLSGQLVEALYVPVDRRVLRRLVRVADLFGDSVVPLTQEDIAQLAGTTRPTANRVLKAAEEAGVLRMTRGRTEILDPERLARMAR